MSQYSETIGSFTRTGNYPLEADYIFESEEALKQFYEDPILAATLHEGLLKVVNTGETLSLYWVVSLDGNLNFDKLISNLDMDNLNELLLEVISKLEKEIQDRINEDNKIWGTSDLTLLPENLNNILKIIKSLLLLQLEIPTLKEELKATVGTEDDDIRSYLKTLDYPSLSSLSNSLHTFLNTVDSLNNEINTWPELLSFLKGYKDTDTLLNTLQTLTSSILGDPAPTELFRTLRNIEDFVRELKSLEENNKNNLQTELDQTLVGVGLSGDGSYNADKETHYLLNATSVMNALKILDSLIYERLLEFVIYPANKDVVPLEVTLINNGYTIGASLLLSNVLGNLLTKKSDGLYYNVNLIYEDGLITLKVNDSIISLFNINIPSILKLGYYDSSNEELVLVFNTLEGTEQTARIPVGNLIREWVPDNTQTTKVVEITREEVVNGPDKVSADVRISEKRHNILTKDVNSLYVEGTSDSITYNDLTLTSVVQDLYNKINTVKTDLLDDVNEKISELKGDLDLEILDRKDGDDKLQELFNSINTNVTNLLTQINNEVTNRQEQDTYLKNYIDTKISEIDLSWYEG